MNGDKTGKAGASGRPIIARAILALLMGMWAHSVWASETSVTGEELAKPDGVAPSAAVPGLARAPFSRTDPACLPRQSPAATLLVPYFEVAIDETDGKTTLFSVVNADVEPVLVRAVLWTDCAVPIMAFDVLLEAGQVAPVNLRDVVTNGVTPDPGFVCTDGQAVPTTGLGQQRLDSDELLRLQARLSGHPDPVDGLCYGEERPGPRLARGYVTVDTMRAVCDPAVRFPYDAGYFSGEAPAASSRNILWGDVFLVDPSQSSAQGFSAVGLRADAERVADLLFLDSPFYGDRLPLPTRFRSRFLSGGSFDGGTRFLLFRNTVYSSGAPVSCEDGCGRFFGANATARFLFQDERGLPVGEAQIGDGAYIRDLRVGSEELPISNAAGWVDIWVVDQTILDPPSFPRLWVQPVYSARERFSVGVEATAIDSGCRQPFVP